MFYYISVGLKVSVLVSLEVVAIILFLFSSMVGQTRVDYTAVVLKTCLNFSVYL